MIRHFVILGGMGDLSGRHLLPALAHLHQAGKLPDGLTVVGVSREELDTAAWRRHVAERLERHAAGTDARSREALVSRLQYRRADVTDRAQMARALDGLDGPLVAYLALPPSVYAGTIEALAGVGPAEGSLVVVEKPFGEDLQSAQALNRLLHETFPERAVFRIDHFLGMQTVQNILGLRFANRVFGHLWDRDHIERVEIVWDETLALEGRAGYYDTAGALKDMIQNHYYSHYSKENNEAPCTRILRFGYAWSSCGENIGYNATPEDMFRSWMRNSIHQRNILDGRFSEIGIGAYSGDYNDSETTMFTVDFGAPTEQTSEKPSTIKKF
jgi:glucose-6-phosphate 1-dehydrogenase